MRKALIGLVLAATILTPVAAQAQESGSEPQVPERYQRLAQRNAERSENRQERQQQRAERQAQRADRVERQEQRVERQDQRVERREQRVERQDRPFERRGDRQGSTVGGWNGPNTPEFREHARRYDRIGRENAVRHGTPEQRREVRQERREDRRDWRQDRREDRRDWRQDRRGDRRDWRQDRREDRRDWNRDWRRDNRYDWQSWRYRNRNIFRGSGYYAPFRNHRYSRFSIGVFLGQPFYDQRYWIGDPWQYRLPPAPPGTRWVRYYNDVLLVDTWDGQVLDVIYDFFW